MFGKVSFKYKKQKLLQITGSPKSPLSPLIPCNPGGPSFPGRPVKPIGPSAPRIDILKTKKEYFKKLFVI